MQRLNRKTHPVDLLGVLRSSNGPQPNIEHDNFGEFSAASQQRAKLAHQNSRGGAEIMTQRRVSATRVIHQVTPQFRKVLQRVRANGFAREVCMTW